VRKLVVPCRIGFHTQVGDRSTAWVGIGVLRAGVSHGPDRASCIGRRTSGLRRYLGVSCCASRSCRASEYRRGTVLLHNNESTWLDHVVTTGPSPLCMHIAQISHAFVAQPTAHSLRFLGFWNSPPRFHGHVYKVRIATTLSEDCRLKRPGCT
jgi:hypothetical protein